MDKNRKIEFQAITLAALLHDIGKFLQRAEVELGYTSKENEITLCPVKKGGYYSHKHVLWTDHFLENHLNLPAGFNKSSLARLAAIHHNPDKDLDNIITVADCLSAGMDRDESDDETVRDGYKKIRLRPVFESVALNRQSHNEALCRHRMEPFGKNTDIAFPLLSSEVRPAEGESLVPEYNKLWCGFKEEVSNILTNDFEVFYSAIHCLLLKYTWCIPSSTIDYPDISLFDHMKTTAAIASCLYLFHLNNDSLNSSAVNDKEKEKFILLTGDLSGIQNYIFNITHIGAGGSAKRLRARSFTVTLMSDLIAEKLIKWFGLTESNILMSSGGKFQILLPNIPNAEKLIAEIDQNTAAWLYDNMNAEIGLNMATSKLCGRDFKDFNKVFKSANEQLQEKKQTPFNSLIMHDGKWTERFVLSHAAFGEEEKLCKACSRFPGDLCEDGKYFCKFCKQDKDIGQKLPKAEYVAIYDNMDAGNFKLFGSSFEILKENELQDCRRKPAFVYKFGEWKFNCNFPVRSRNIALHIPLLDKDDCTDCQCEEKENIRVGDPMMFECIAKKSMGDKVLGYLKADVDRLGEIFAFGLKDQQKSVSRIATMSRMFELFFSSHIIQLCNQHPYVYIVYSGGDDLLLIGPWDMVIKLAITIEDDFKRFTCRNPDITISAAFIIAKHGMPVFKTVLTADAALHEAKELPLGNGRNQLHIFGDQVKWEKVDDIMKHTKRLSGWIDDNKVSRGLVRNFLTYGEMKKNFEKDGDTKYLRYIPLMTYDIARNLPSPDKDTSGLRQWAQTLIDEPEATAMKHLTIIANYALMANRSRRDGQ